MIDLLGWIGFVSGISAFVLLSFLKESDEHKRNLLILAQSLNVTCSIGFIISSAYYKFWQSTAFNVIWLGISAYFLIKEIRKV